MPEANVPATPQAGAADPINPPGQEPTTPPAEPQAGEPPKPSKSAEDYERMIAELRKENAGHRTKLKSFEDADRERQEAQLSKEKLLEKRLAEAQSRESEVTLAAQERLIDAEIRYQMALRGIKSPRVARLIEREQLVFDDRGVPTNVDALLKEILTEIPDLVPKNAPAPPPQTAGGATQPSRSQSSGDTGEITASYVADVMSGKIAWRELSKERQSAVLAWQAKNPYRF